MKRASIILSLLIFLNAVVFSGGKQEAAAKATIQFWLYGGSPQNVEWSHKMIDRFNKEHPKIEIVVTDQGWETIFEHFQTAATTGTLPDVARVHAPYVSSFGAKGGYLEPIDNFPDFIKTKNLYVDGYIDALKSGGKYWGLPVTVITFILQANKKMFDDAGISKVPDTWDALRATAKKLSHGDQYGYGIMGGILGGHAYRLVEYAYKAGARVFNDDWTKSLVNEPPWKAAVQLMVDMKKDGSVPPSFLADDFVGLSDKFAANKIAMSIEGPYWPGVIRSKRPDFEFLYGVVPKPDKALGTATPGTLLDAAVMVITKRCKYKQEAWEFIKFFTGPEADIDFAKSVDLGGLPVIKATLSRPEWKKFEGYAAYSAEGATAKPWPYHPSLQEITNDVIATLTLKAINGDISVDEAMAEAEKKIDAILKR